MAHYFVYIAYFVFVLNSVSRANPAKKIKITVGTTAGCSNTAKFINEQLVEAYRQYSEHLEIEFVPWGRTVRDVSGTLTCQFGKRDCWANRLQRCTLELLKGDTAAQLEYMKCEFTRPFPSYAQAAYRCATAAGQYKAALQCMKKGSDKLDKAAEEKAQQAIQIINYVPSISINDVHSAEEHNKAIKDLAGYIKSKLP